MDKRENEPLAPKKPPEIDPELNATAATAVEQWRNYQQAYAAYQQQYAAYQQYIQQRQYAQTVEQQQMAYSHYLERHSQYQYQLQQYEQHHHQQPPSEGMPSWSADPYALPNPMMVQQPPMPALHQIPGQMNGYTPMLPVQEPMPDYAATNSGYAKSKKRLREPRAKFRTNEKKSELHTKTVVYVNPDDETMLPVDLKKLFKDFQCDLCRTRMNSHISANIHYQSKSHEKKITQWLKEYCAETGTPMPVRVRRQPELATEVTAAAGQSVFHCEACDLPLTSIQHANQHYTGKRHWMVVNGKKLPSGNGFYSAEGKWIRSGNIVTEPPELSPNAIIERPPRLVAQSEAKRPRLEPPPVPPKELIGGVNWQMDAPSTSTNGSIAPPMAMPQVAPMVNVTVVAVATPRIEPQPILTIKVDSDEDEAVPAAAPVAKVSAPISMAPPVAALNVAATAPKDDPLPITNTTKALNTTLEQEIRKKDGLDCVDETGTFCLICETSVTSRSEMLMHMKGAKHLKKARTKGMAVRTTPFNPSDTILKSLSKPVRKTDWSLYRMPSGKFYCKTCNLIVADEKLFGQHWYGKKHKLKMRQEQTGGQQAKHNGASTSPAVSVVSPATVVNPFASDDIELLPAAYGNIEATADIGQHKANLGKLPHRRFNRPFFFGKRTRMSKPRKSLPVTN